MHRIRFRIDLGPQCSIGPGKIDLLEAVSSTGSIRQAARALRMSYRYAWLLIDSINKSFSEPATTSSVGGSGGGGVELTPFGAELVRRYRRMAARFDALAEAELGPVVEKLAARSNAEPETSRPRNTGRKSKRTAASTASPRRRLARPAGGTR